MSEDLPRKRQRRELHSERLGSIDEHGKRVYIHPENVKGPWRDRRSITYWVLILVYFTLPWIHIGGKQIVLLDIFNREFTFFGTTFFSHDAPLVFYVFLIFVLIFGYITAQWGRLWCGWGCPQTVFIDSVYLKIERWVEGKPRARRELDLSPNSFQKYLKKSIKWFLFLIVSMHLSHTFLGYFLGARELFFITLSPPTENMASFVAMLVLTGIIIFDFGWFREQFCIVVCPYGRMQSVMMDEHSLVVAYDNKRGEPRRDRGVIPKNEEGHCIDCYHCVKVCPTGIDIRRGSQLECIACTNCIDACDEIMEKVGLPKGLIRYDSQTEIEGKKRNFWRFRPLIYLVATVLAIGVFSYGIYSRGQLKVQFIRGSNSPFQVIKRSSGEAEIVNHYKLSVYYNGVENYNLLFRPSADYAENKLRIVTQKTPHPIIKGKKQKINLFFRFNKSILLNGRKNLKLKIFDGQNFKDAKFLREEEVSLVGPF
ncbi:MAG: cytochrome c oxidase accessory protein CcoG [Halobacteriovoraceae bacterium]|nr:cytochrome c oxidase accessory protein CcoG [Halobacteriovoraceae bacterium]MBT5095044.1 cytochrome c oxidase accessory protein CcoG [Halobacteriovoraceae bacterium]